MLQFEPTGQFEVGAVQPAGLLDEHPSPPTVIPVKLITNTIAQRVSYRLSIGGR
jgi:hypothetical protein